MTVTDRMQVGIRPWSPALHVAVISLAAGLVIVLQDVVMASRFAAGNAADAYQLAMSFPLVALNVFAGGTLLAVMVPRLVQLEVTGNPARAAALVRRMRRSLGWLLLAVCAVWAAIFPQVVGRLAGDWSPSTIDLSVRLLWAGLPVLAFLGLSGVDAAVLNSRRHFGLLSALPAFMPAGVAAGVLLLGSHVGIFAASIGAVCGSAVQWLAARRRTAQLLGPAEGRTETHKPAGLASAYGALATAAALLGGIPMTDTLFASTLSPGSTATLGYASRPVLLLLAFATTIFGNLTLPMFSRLAAANDRQALKIRFLALSGLLALAALPIVVIAYSFAPLLVALLYERGSFSATDTANVAAVLQIYVLHVPFFAVGAIAWRLLNSLQLHVGPLIITAVAFGTNVAADFWLAPRMGLAGIAWGTNTAFSLWALLLVLYLLVVARRISGIPTLAKDGRR